MKVFCKYIFCVCIVFVLMMCAGCGVTEYSVKDFADVTVIGYTEHGSLSIKVNDSTVNRIYADGKKDKTAALRFAGSFRFSYDGQNSDDSYFNNGDVVTINVTYDENMAKDLGISFVDSSFEYTIEGLEDKVQMSPFDGLSVEFNGVDPYGTIQLDKSNCIQYVIDNVTFYCDSYDLSNGDTVIVRAEYNAEIAERNGYVFTEDAKKFKVVGLSKYVTTMMGVTYSPISARMRYMVEQYVGGTETSYKSLKWFFGEEDSDSDEYVEEDDSNSETSSKNDDDEINENDENNDDFSETSEDSENPADDTTSSNTSSKSKKKKSDVQKIKDDFVLSNFNAKFEYTPIQCYYALNPLQYSDNIFIASYKVKGVFVCTDTAGSGYIKKGDTVVGELYVTASLTGGSVDIKNNLVYENTTLENPHAYSIRSYPKFEEMSGDVFQSTTYVVEQLTYVEDQEAYDKFAKDQKNFDNRSKREDAHITVPSKSSDSDKNTSSKKKRTSSLEDTETETDTDTDVIYDYDDEETEIITEDSDDEQYDYNPNDDYNYDEESYDDEEEY